MKKVKFQSMFLSLILFTMSCQEQEIISVDKNNQLISELRSYLIENDISFDNNIPLTAQNFRSSGTIKAAIHISTTDLLNNSRSIREIVERNNLDFDFHDKVASIANGRTLASCSSSSGHWGVYEFDDGHIIFAWYCDDCVTNWNFDSNGNLESIISSC